MLLMTRGGGKTFIIAVYIILRLLFCQGSKIVVVAAAFRQSKLVFEYVERLWYGSPVLRDMVAGQQGARGR